jgi:hypothetical protein
LKGDGDLLKIRQVILIFFSLSLLFIFTSCSNQEQTVSSKKASEINVKEYFPPLVTRNQYISPNDDGSNQIIIEVAKFAVGLNNETERIIESTNYQGNIALGQSVTQYTVTDTEIADEKGSIQLSNKPEWESDGIKMYLVDINKTVEVRAGTFENCIEVLRIDPKTKYQARFIYAPNVGAIKLTSKSEGKEEKVLVELTSTSTTPYGKSNQDNTVNEPANDVPLESTSNEENTDIEGIDTTVELINNNISKLKLMNFEEKVNQISTEQLEQRVLHRPAFQEESDYYIASYNVNTPENIVIFTSKDSNIKQITWESKELLTEETLLIIQWLLLSLGENISREDANEFLFHQSLTEQHFGEFTVKFIKSNDGFKFNIFVE